MEHVHFKKLPHWYVKDKVFYNKLQALEACQSSRENLRFWFFDEAFSSLDWMQEPEEDWHSMLGKRAWQLREIYDYIRISYSGGVDSQTILNTFLREGIFIDEIIMYRQSPVNKFEDYSNIEINEVALPFLKSVENQLRGTKITIRDWGIEHWDRYFAYDGWQYESPSLDFRTSGNLLTSNLFPDEVDYGVYDHPRGRLMCNLKGEQKPRITKRKNRYFAYYSDAALAGTVGDQHVDSFYLTPDYPELHLKQCHLLKRRIKEKFPDLESIDDLLRFRPENSFLDDWNSCCRDPLWNGITLGKTEDVYTPKCKIYLRDAQEADLPCLKNYLGAMKEESQNESGLWRFNENQIQKQLHGIIWKEFDMGE